MYGYVICEVFNYFNCEMYVLLVKNLGFMDRFNISIQ